MTETTARFALPATSALHTEEKCCANDLSTPEGVLSCQLFGQDNSDQLQAVQRSLAVAEFGGDGTLLDANGNYLTLFGYLLSEVKGRHHSIFLFPEDAAAAEYVDFWSSLKKGTTQNAQLRRRSKHGEELWVQASYTPVFHPDGSLAKIIKLASNITDQKQRDADRQCQIEAIRKSLAVAEFTVDGFLLDANPNFLRIFGYELEEVRGSHHSIFVSPAFVRSPQYRSFWRRLRKGYYQSSQFNRQSKDGREVWLDATYNPILTASGKPYKIVKLARDVTEERTRQLEHQRQISYAATHDTLTGLLNRSGLYKAFGENVGPGVSPTLILIDLDGFKPVNDVHGHAVGDELLKVVSARILQLAGSDSLVCRFGGDEFAILLLETPATEASTAARAEALVAGLCAPYCIAGREIVIGASLGIRLGKAELSDLDQMLDEADIALYDAKGNGKRSYRIFDDRLFAAGLRQRELDRDLEDAIRCRTLFLEYQPIVDLSSGKKLGVEALMRWRHPRFGWISPSEFIDRAEATGLIEPLGLFLLQQVMDDIDGLALEGTVSLNVSPRQLNSGLFVDVLLGHVQAGKLDPRRIELELTETAVVSRNENLIKDLTRLKQAGIRISLDDFGTGYSSLSLLTLCRFDRLKIDRSFVAKVTTDPEYAAIVSAIIQLARALDMTVIAEGVETVEQREVLRVQGCHAAQGFLFRDSVAAQSGIASNTPGLSNYPSQVA